MEKKRRGEGGENACKHGKWIGGMRNDGIYYFADSVFIYPREWLVSTDSRDCGSSTVRLEMEKARLFWREDRLWKKGEEIIGCRWKSGEAEIEG